MKLESFATWAEVLAYAATKAPLYYHAPLDVAAVRLESRATMPPAFGRHGSSTYCARPRTIRVWPPGSTGRGEFRTADPFTADAGHLNRFRKPVKK